MSEWNQWFVSVGERTVGPVSTDLVIRGIEHRKIPVEALVCVEGGSTWMSLGTIAVFHAAVVRSYPPPPPNSDDERYWLLKGFRFPKPAPLPTIEELGASASQAENDDEVDVEWEEDERVDWTQGFSGYFMAGDPVELPSESALLESLRTTSPDVFQQDEALWNLALCLAYGSDRIGEAAGRTFFASVLEHGALERLDWMNRTLLGSGFVPSGIAPQAGKRAFERLRALCPPELAVPLRGRVA
jgi:hypothetical protein